MTKDEFKLRLVTEVNKLIDVYFSENAFMDKMANTTLKILVERNKHKLDGMLDLFIDENGNIDAEAIINQYAEHFSGDGMKFDLRQYVKSDFVRNVMPDKFLIINKEDILNIIKN